MPLNETDEVEMKFVPFTVSRFPVGKTPTAVPEGESELIVGSGFCAAVIVKLTAVEAPPPGNGLTTTTCAEPAVAICWAVTEMESCVEVALNAVVCAALFQYTTDVEMKPVPEIFNVNPGPPAVALDGKRLMIAGVSL